MGELWRGWTVCKDAVGRWDLWGLNQRHCWCTEPDKWETAETAACLTVLKINLQLHNHWIRNQPFWLLQYSPHCKCCCWTSFHMWGLKAVQMWLKEPEFASAATRDLALDLEQADPSLETAPWSAQDCVPVQLRHITVSSCLEPWPGALTYSACSLKGLG